MFGIINKNGKLIDTNNLYNLTANNFMYKIEKNSSNNTFYRNEIKLKKCNYNEIENGIKKYYENITKEEYEKYFCFEKNQNISFYGKNGDNLHDFKTLSIVIEKNNFSGENEEEIEKEELNYFILYYLKDTVDHSKLKLPIKRFLSSEIFPISDEYSKKFSLYFAFNEYISDNGIFFTHKTNFNFIDIDKTDFDLNENSNKVISLTFTSSENKKIYKREYLRLQNVISNIGGCINCLYLLCKFITKYFAKKSLTMDITKTLICDNCKKICKQHLTKEKKLTYLSKNNHNFLLKLNSIKRKSSFEKNNSQKLNINFKQRAKKKNSFFVPVIQIQKDFDKIEDNINEEKNKVLNSIPEITNERLKYLLNKIENFPANQKQLFEFKVCDYLLPNICLKKINRFSLLNVYSEIFNSFMSIEQIIPVIENFSKLCTESASIGMMMRGVSSFHIFNQLYEKKNLNKNLINIPNQKSSLKKVSDESTNNNNVKNNINVDNSIDKLVINKK
jgi:hypothetical protein